MNSDNEVPITATQNRHANEIDQQLREVAIDWLKNSEDSNTHSLRMFILEMLGESK